MAHQDPTWTIIPDFEGHQVNSSGQIRNIQSGKVLGTSVNDSGVRYVSIRNTTTKRYQNMAVSRIVASVFCSGHSAQCDTVLHLNGNTEDNRAPNLMWATRWHTIQYHQEINDPRFRKVKLRVKSNGVLYENIIEAAMSTGCLPSAIDYAAHYNDTLAKDEHVNFVHKVWPGGHIFRSVK